MSAIIAPVPARRRRTDKVMRGVLLAGTLVALVPLVLVVYYLIKQGIGAISWDFFTTDPTGRFLGPPGGVKSAIIGTILIVGLASVIAIPIGIGVALYLVEYGRKGVFAQFVRYFVDVMTGVPSIVFGLFIYISLVISHAGGSGFAGWKGALALALLMLPIVIRSSEVVLLLVPFTLREAALALGAPRWRIIWKVVLPTASVAFGLSGNLNGIMNSLPMQIFGDITSPRDVVVARAWGAALTLVALVLILNVVARAVSRRSRLT